MAENEDYSANKYFSPKNIIIYLIVAALLYGAIYFLFLKKDSTYSNPTNTMTSEDTSSAENTMTVSLEAQNDSGQNGTATLTEKDGKTTVSIMVDKDPSGTPQPVHIHTGACPTPGDVVYPLTNLVDGKSETVIEADLAALRSQLPLAINVHKSINEASVYVSCGDLK